jgi:flagellar motor protein MotB
VQAYVDAVNLLRSSASASLSISAALTLTDFAALGLPTIDTNSEMSLFNQIATGIGFSAVDTIAERSLLLALVDKVMALAAVTPPAALPQPTLTAADLTALGVTGVDSSNIAVVLSALAATANDGSGVDTTAKIQAVAQAAIAAQSATTLIAGYTAASGQIAPTASDFVAAGVTGVTSSNISLVNEFLASLPAGSRDTASEIQALVDAVNHIILQANGVGDNGSHITAADLAALGFAAPAGTTASVVSLVNSAADEMNALVSPSLIDTAAEFANLMRITSSIAATASGLGANPALTAEDFQVLGVVGVDATNLAAMINQIIATSDDASGVNSLAKLNALLAAANAVAARDSAIAELMAYTGTQTAPTSSTYSDANVSGVNGLNIATINSLIADLPESAKDSTGEIQSIVDAYAKVATLANSSAGGTATSSLTASEFATLGLSTIDNSTEVALMNTWLDTSASTAVDSSSELNAVANAIAKLAATAAVTPPATLPSPALTLADLYVLGISGATSENLATIIAFIANSANDASGVSSVTALQNLVDAAASQAFSDAAALQISLYDGVGAAPTRNQYTDAGVTGVDLANRDTVNSIVAALTPARSDTTAELQAVVDSVDKIRALADGTAANGGASALSAQNFAAIGLFAIDTAAEVALFNSILDAQQVSDVDSMSELAEIARIVQAIVAAAAGLTSNPALAPEDFALIGIAGVDNANLSATLALIGATNDNATGVDSLAELAAIQVAGQQAAAIAQASELIASYSGTNQAPVLATYVTVGVNGVNATNLTAVNAFLAPISSAQSDSQAEVQAIVDAVNKLAALADSSTATGAALSSADLLALGVAEFSAPGVAEKMSLLNSLLDVKSLQDVGSPADLAALIEIINRLINKTLGQIVVPEISESDFAALGISGVTTAPDGGNLSVVLAVLSSTQPSAVDTATELANVIASIVADLTSNPSLKVIVDYAENNSNTKPVVLDYTSIPGSGTALVDDSTIVAINALIDSKTASEVSTSAKVSQLIYEFFVALGRIVEFARDSTMNEAPTLADYQIAGLRTIDANSVAAMNAVIAGLQASEVDTPAKLQAILDRLRSASGNTTSPITAGPINRITLTEGTLGPVIKWDGSNSVSVEVISSSGVIKTLLINGQNETSLDLSKLESGRAYAILVSPVGSTNPADSQRVAYAVAPATPSKTEVSPISSNRLQLTWTQTGYAKQYQIIATPSKGRVVTMLTSNTSAQLNLIAGRKYEVTITAIGEGDKRSSAVIADVNLPGAISTVIATPVAGKKQTLVSWTPLVVQPNARYQVRVNGKVVCTSTLTSCAVPQTLSSKQDVTVSLVGGPATAVEIVDSKLVYTNDVGFIPNTTTLAPGARAEILASAKALVAAKFTTVVVTGHANPVDGIPLKISTKLANDRALVIVKMLRKLMPGVKIVAVGRSVFSPSNPGLNQSLGNIRAEIYGTR